MKDAYQQLVVDLDAETNRIADLVQALIDQANAGGLSAVDEQAFLDQLNAIRDRLRVVGSDSGNPIPNP